MAATSYRGMDVIVNADTTGTAAYNAHMHAMCRKNLKGARPLLLVYTMQALSAAPTRQYMPPCGWPTPPWRSAPYNEAQHDRYPT